nr:hypothetical protein [Tanacetum cinerariifolium]
LKTMMAVLWNPTVTKSVGIDIPNVLESPHGSTNIGFIYWKAYDFVALGYHRMFNLIVLFDLKNDEFGKVCLPDSLVEADDISAFKFKDSLGLIHHYLILMMGYRFVIYTGIVGFRKNGEAVMETEIDGCPAVLEVYEPSGPYNDIGVSGNAGSQWSLTKSVGIDILNVLDTHGSTYIGFGVWSNTSDIKLVRINCIDGDDHSTVDWEAKVFTLRFIYWKAYDSMSLGYDRMSNLIVSFGLKNDEFGKVFLPDSLVEADNISAFKFKESLGLIHHYLFFNDGIPFCDVWILKEGVTKSFRKMFSMKMRPFLKAMMAVFWKHTVTKSVGIDIPNVLDTHGSTYIGFGVWSNTSDIKLVRINCIDGDDHSTVDWEAKVFTLSTRVWKSVSNILLAVKTYCLTYGHVSVGGFIYWKAYDSMALGYHRMSNLIVSFDLKNDEFGKVCLPDSLIEADNISAFRFKESLGLILLGYGSRLARIRYEYLEDTSYNTWCFAALLVRRLKPQLRFRVSGNRGNSVVLGFIINPNSVLLNLV